MNRFRSYLFAGHRPFRALSLLLLTVLLLGGLVADSRAAPPRRKNLLSLRLRSNAKKGKGRVVMRLNQGGFYESEEDFKQQRLLIRLYDFHNYGARPVKLVDDPLFKSIDITQKEQYLEIAIYLKPRSYQYEVSLFEKPAMCVVDIKANEPLVKKPPVPAPVPPGKAPSSEKPQKPEKTQPSEQKHPVAAVGTKDQPEKREAAAGKPEKPVAQTAASKKTTAGPEAVPVEKQPPAAPAPVPVAEKTPAQVPAPESDKLPAAVKTPPAAGNPLAESQPLPAVPDVGSTPAGAQKNPTPSGAETPAPVSEVAAPASAPTAPSRPETKGAVETAPPGQELFDQGLKAYQEEDFAAAEEFFSRLVETYPKSPLAIPASFRRLDAKAQAALAEARDRRQVVKVIEEFLKQVRAHADHPEAAWAYLQVARLYERIEFFYEAAGVYRALLKRFPESSFAPAANFALARLSFSLRRYQDAYDEFTRLLKKYPRGGFVAYAHFYRANSLYHLGKVRQALSEYRTALESDPDFLKHDPLSLYLLGSTYHRLKRYREAQEYFLMMRNLFPDNKYTSQALAKIGEILVLEKKYDQAMLMFTVVVKEFPGSEGDIVSRLKMAILGEKDAIRRKLEKINPRYADFLDSEAAYRYLIEHYPDSPYTDIARLNLGRLYRRRQQFAKARPVLEEMLTRRLKPGLRDAAFQALRETIYAEIEADFQKRDYRGIVALQDRYRDDFLSRPGAIYPFLWIGQALAAEGLPEGALKVFQALRKFKPRGEDRFKIDYGIVHNLLETGDYEAAEKFLAGIRMDSLPALWRQRLLLCRVRILEHQGQAREALALLNEIKDGAVVLDAGERTRIYALVAELYDRIGADADSLAALEQAVSQAFSSPDEVDSHQRYLLGLRLARRLFQEKRYAEAGEWFARLQLLAPAGDSPELFFWQLSCAVARQQTEEIRTLYQRLVEDFPASPWTASARTLVKDYRWQQESRTLK